MADLAQLEKALINADRAGDVGAATVLAKEVKRLRALGGTEKNMPSTGGAEPPQMPADALPAQIGPMQPSWGETAVDVAKSGGAGIARGGLSVLGLPRDLSNLAQAGIEYGAGKMGFDGKSAGDAFSTVNPLSYLPSTDQLQGAVEGVTGEFYHPKTTSGEYAKTIGEFLPATLLGPGTIGRKLAISTLGGAGSETAGQMSKGSDAEPYMRVAGGLLGGSVGTVVGRGGAAAKLLKDAPTQAAIKTQKGDIYSALRDSDVRYDQNDFNQFAHSLASDLKTEGLHLADSGSMNNIMDEIAGYVSKGQALDFNEMDALRKAAGKMSKSADDTERLIGGTIVSKIDDFEETAGLTTNGKIAPGDVHTEARKARELARRDILLKQLSEMDRKSKWYVSGSESGMRNQIGSFGRSSKGKSITAEEEKALIKASKREGLLNVATTTGGRFNQAFAPAAGVGAGAMIGGIPGALLGGAASLATHLVARKGMERYTAKAVDKARKVIALGKEGQKKLSQARKSDSKDRALTVPGLLEAGQAHEKGAPPFRLPNGSMYWNPSWAEYRAFQKGGGLLQNQ